MYLMKGIKMVNLHPSLNISEQVFAEGLRPQNTTMWYEKVRLSTDPQLTMHITEEHKTTSIKLPTNGILAEQH